MNSRGQLEGQLNGYLMVVTALGNIWSLVPCTYKRALTNIYYSSYRRLGTPFWPPQSSAHAYTNLTRHTQMHTIKSKINLKLNVVGIIDRLEVI